MILGQGAFGKVMRANALGIETPDQNTKVAVKMTRGIHTSCETTNHVVIVVYILVEFSAMIFTCLFISRCCRPRTVEGSPL